MRSDTAITWRAIAIRCYGCSLERDRNTLDDQKGTNLIAQVLEGGADHKLLDRRSVHPTADSRGALIEAK